LSRLALTWQSFSSFLYKTHFAKNFKLLFRSHLANFSNFCSGLVFAKFLKFFYVQDSFGKVSLKLLFRTHFVKFFKLLVQDSFGKVSQVFCVQNSFGKVSQAFVQDSFCKVSQAFCSGLIWQSSSSFMLRTDLAKFFNLFVQD
jgi:hypothetical protein